MQRASEERLIAYLDGELAESERAEIALWLERDPALREHAAQLSESAALLRTAFDEVLREPLPERLVAAARGETAHVVDLAMARASRWKRIASDRRWWIGLPVAASLVGLIVGTQLAGLWPDATSSDQLRVQTIDNLAGYHRLYITARPDDSARFDVPAGQKLPPDFRLPNLKPWGLDFQGARYLFIEGRPAIQLFYSTDNKALGPLTVVIASTTKPDLTADFEHRDDVNVVRWRYHGHAYALVGTANYGYLWNIHNDIAYQLDSI
jgi:anti-sigma factor RsiW